jgi:hypothetical protein
MLDGEVIDKTTCDPESFSYELQSAGFEDVALYRMFPPFPPLASFLLSYKIGIFGVV